MRAASLITRPAVDVAEAQADTGSVSNPSSGMFEIAEASGVRTGTKIIIHLKEDCKEFANEDRVKGEWRREVLLCAVDVWDLLVLDGWEVNSQCYSSPAAPFTEGIPTLLFSPT